jgi:haloacid dehalogenase superfamily, subfamily IA, variant 3 with third motif having DD or ED
MDGVLYDSMPSHVKAWKETMSLFGIESSLEDFYLYEGRTGASTINILFNRTLDRDATKEEIETIYAQKAKRFVELEGSGSKPMPGAMEVLERVRSLKLKQVIVTGSGQHSLINKLDKDFPGFFKKNLMVTAYDVKFGKPHPEPYLMGLNRADVRADEALVIENAPLGVEAGKAAKIQTIAVNTGPLPDQILLDAGADWIFPTMEKLAKEIENILRQ